MLPLVGKSWSIVASVSTNFSGSGTNNTGMPSAAGATSVNVATNLVPSGTIYIGIVFNSPSASDTIDVTNLLANIV